MQRHLYYISGIQMPPFTHYVFYYIMILGWGNWASAQAQNTYRCTLKVSPKLRQKTANSATKNKWTVFVEQYKDTQCIGLLGKQKLSNQTNRPSKNLAFNAASQHVIHLRFSSSQSPFIEQRHTFSLTNDSLGTQQTHTIRLDTYTTVTMVLHQQLLTPTQTGAPRLWVTTYHKENIQGVSGIKVLVKYLLPPGVNQGKGYVKALMQKRRPQPLLIYRIEQGKLVNDLMLNFTSDTLNFALFIPYHELPYWRPSIGFQLVHVAEACLLTSFWVKTKYRREDGYDLKGQISLLPVRKYNASGISFGVNLQLPSFYIKNLKHNFLRLQLFGKVNNLQRVWGHQRFQVKQLAGWQNKVWLRDSFLPYAVLAKYTGKLKIQLEVGAFLTGLRSTIFYTGYPQKQSSRVMYKEQTCAITLPPMQCLKIRPVFLKMRKKDTITKPLKTRTLQLTVRIQRYKLYQTRRYTYQKKLRFDKNEKDTLALVKNDTVTLEVTDNGYPKKVLFHASVSCTADILRRKFWKLKDKYGNYLKIAVQKLTTGKDKFLHTNGKKKTKTLGGRR
ncbi:hypothetical protein [uncultured Microscilla sp.]|uniref:hypothetical protein n=1 Tax=uncultured Microscilla sp. TaxID=432653 RepID=UPI002628FE13|nr:hypothetical protein [uncultured Microscilla sp.]